MDIDLLVPGPKCFLYELVIKKKCLVREYISSLDNRNKKKVFALLKHIAGNGPPTNEEKFKYIKDEIWELKIKGIRILSFFQDLGPRDSLILTHGFPKAKKKIFDRHVERATNWRKEYFQRADKNDTHETTGVKS